MPLENVLPAVVTCNHPLGVLFANIWLFQRNYINCFNLCVLEELILHNHGIAAIVMYELMIAFHIIFFSVD